MAHPIIFDIPTTGPGTEFGDKCESLAQFLHDMVFGPGRWAEANAHQQDMYHLDAGGALIHLPHLLTLDERERLQEHIPALALGFISGDRHTLPSPAAMGATAETGPGTVYGDALAALAQFLHSIPYGPGTWADAEPGYRTNYTIDAAELLALHPHLIGLQERDRLAKTVPALAP